MVINMTLLLINRISDWLVRRVGNYSPFYNDQLRDSGELRQRAERLTQEVAGLRESLANTNRLLSECNTEAVGALQNRTLDLEESLETAMLQLATVRNNYDGVSGERDEIRLGFDSSQRELARARAAGTALETILQRESGASILGLLARHAGRVLERFASQGNATFNVTIRGDILTYRGGLLEALGHTDITGVFGKPFSELLFPSDAKIFGSALDATLRAPEQYGGFSLGAGFIMNIPVACYAHRRISASFMRHGTSGAVGALRVNVCSEGEDFAPSSEAIRVEVPARFDEQTLPAFLGCLRDSVAQSKDESRFCVIDLARGLDLPEKVLSQIGSNLGEHKNVFLAGLHRVNPLPYTVLRALEDESRGAVSREQLGIGSVRYLGPDYKPLAEPSSALQPRTV